jgi:hypothetical protein
MSLEQHNTNNKEPEVGRYFALPPSGSSLPEIAAFMKKQMATRQAFLERQEELRSRAFAD